MDNQKQLLIVRHGKSSWKYKNIEDIDRHLKEKGIIDAYEMANRLKKRDLCPGQIISSPAARAFHTASIFCRTLDYPAENIKIQSSFYPGDDDNIIQIIKDMDDTFNSVMIFGHNPAFTDVTNRFTSEDLDKLPTTGIAIVDFDVRSWKEIDKKHVRNIEIDYPKKQK